MLEIPLTGNSSPLVLQPDLEWVDRLPVPLLSRLPFQVALLDLGRTVMLLPKSLMLFSSPELLFPLKSDEGEEWFDGSLNS